MRIIAATALLALALAGCAEPREQGFGGSRPMPPGPGAPGGGGHFPSGGGPHRDLFFSPMGEPFHADGAVSGEELWFRGADTNHDGFLTRAEMVADALRFHAILDTNKDGEIDPDEMAHYENDIAPEVRSGGGGMGGGQRGGGGHGGGGRGRGGGGHGGGMGGGGHGGGGMGGGGMGGGGMGGGGMGGGGMGGEDGGEGPPDGGGAPSGGGARQGGAGGGMRQGAGRFSFLDIPQPVIAADTDFNRGVSRLEFAKAAAERFAMLDTNHHGKIPLADLPELPAARGRRQAR